MRGELVFTATQMREIEERAFSLGESGEIYMENVGKKIARRIQNDPNISKRSTPIHLVVGKGNNGGDALVAGSHLIKEGFSVFAHLLHPLEKCSILSQKMGKRFQRKRGKLSVLTRAPSFEEGVLIDGLFGTGFQGEVRGLAEELIESVNRSLCPVFSIDIPSGIHGDTGESGRVAVRADTTLCLGKYKLGCFIGSGWDHVGQLELIDFGMPSRCFEDVDPVASLPSEPSLAQLLPKGARSRHKYETGYVLAVAGSNGMGGAALLSCFASLRGGAGITRLFYPKEMEGELGRAPYELIKEGWDLERTERFFEEEKRAKALLIGPGMGREKKAERLTLDLLKRTHLPTVIDADALFFLSKHREAVLPKKTILTPHQQEMKRLLDASPTWELCQRYAKEKEVVLVLKGAPTLIFYSEHPPLIVPRGSPAMATAGSGDVLTGLLAALLAQGLTPYEAAQLGVWIHAVAGEAAAQKETEYGVIASDLIDSFKEGIRALQSLNQ